MALYVRTLKVHEQPEYADFTFGETDYALGRLRFDKATGEAVLVEPAPGDGGLHRYHRAVLKIAKFWRQNGRWPDEASWAS